MYECDFLASGEFSSELASSEASGELITRCLTRPLATINVAVY